MVLDHLQREEDNNKPFGTVGTLVIFTLLSCMFQYIMAWLIVKFGRRMNNKLSRYLMPAFLYA